MAVANLGSPDDGSAASASVLLQKIRTPACHLNVWWITERATDPHVHCETLNQKSCFGGETAGGFQCHSRHNCRRAVALLFAGERLETYPQVQQGRQCCVFLHAPSGEQLVMTTLSFESLL